MTNNLGAAAAHPWRLSRRDLVALDAVAALGYVLLLLSAGRGGLVGNAPAWSQLLMIAGIGLPVAVRRLWPVPVFWLVLAASILAVPLRIGGYPFVAAAYALYPVALTQPSPRWVPTRAIGVLTAVGLLAAVLALPHSATRAAAGTALLDAMLLGSAWTLGHAAREWRAAAARSAVRQADRAVAAERLRIARELHDIVSHSIGLITVKAGVANHVLHDHPEEAHDALRVIEATGRSALGEMRRLLDVLRAAGSGDDTNDLAPTPGLDALPALARRTALAGVPVDLELGDVGRLPHDVELSVYRIVQEALTNVVKHAGAAHCQVRIGTDGDAVTVEVTDDGEPTSRPADHGRTTDAGGRVGHGLVGMRERVSLYGGVLVAGPRPEGGFAVHARLPYQPAPALP
ncbi:sensor histidine kinase [Rugosimonospora acidiphila]|uniref:histidine kinase n=1 Tax=Rugosimonospora acidiphila TaxID=556531 RepID=A0ABP9RT56_9ACTN